MKGRVPARVVAAIAVFRLGGMASAHQAVNFIAADARTGLDLWHVRLGAAIYSTAITYRLDGK